MANICDQIVVIVAETDADMLEVLDQMAVNVMNGPGAEHYFTREDYEKARGNVDRLYELIHDTTQDLNKIFLFTTNADSGAESGWYPESMERVQGHPVFHVEIGVKWGPSCDPGKFCEQLDPERYGYCIGDGGEYAEWEMISAGGDYFDENIPDVIKDARKKRNSAVGLKEIAYFTCLGAFEPYMYEMYAEGNMDW